MGGSSWRCGSSRIGPITDDRGTGDPPAGRFFASAGELRGYPDARMPAACDDLLVRPTVVIVDDDSGFRSLARALLEAEGFDVVGEADDGASALAAVDLLHPRCARSATSWSAPGRQSQRTWA